MPHNISDVTPPGAPMHRDLTGIVLALLMLGILIVCSFRVLAPFLPAFAWAATIVIASWPLMLKVQTILRGKRSLAVLVMTLMLILVLILPLTIAIGTIAQHSRDITHFAQRLAENGIPQPPEWVAKIPLVGSRLADKWQQAASIQHDELAEELRPYIGEIVPWFARRIGSVGSVFVHFLLTIILAVILYVKGELCAQGVLRFARRLAGERAEKAALLAASAIRATASGILLTNLFQAILLLIGFIIAGVPYAGVLGSLVFLLGVVQIGAVPVLIGVAIWLFHFSTSLTTWSFLIWALAVVTAEHLLRPILIKRGANFPLILIFAGVIGGLISFGVIGIFVGPVVLAVGFTWLQAWTNETRGPAAVM